MRHLKSLVFIALMLPTYLSFGQLQNNNNNLARTNHVAPGTCDICPNNNNGGRNGNEILNPMFMMNKCGLDYVQTTVRLGQRMPQPGAPQPTTFTIAGIPPGAVIEQAFLWSSMSGTSIIHQVTITNPLAVTNSYPMDLIGNCKNKCWGAYDSSNSYRADITAIIAGNGNYIVDALPTNPPIPLKDTDGATMMIIFTDPAATDEGHIVIEDGCRVPPAGTTSESITGFLACAQSLSAKAFMVIGDLQLNGTTITMNGNPINVVWNWMNCVETPTVVAAGQTTSTFTVAAGGDCYNIVAIGLQWVTQGCGSLNFTVATTTPDTCGLCNGTATVAATGGAPPYTYQWGPGTGNQTTQTATGLCPGSYAVTVVDNTGCANNDTTLTVLTTGGFITALTSTPANCFGVCDGDATVTPSAGIPPYVYLWDFNAGNQTTQTATGLCAGMFYVTVTDNSGCPQPDSILVTEPTLMVLSDTLVVDVDCFGYCDGQGTVLATGGTPPYAYSWPNGGNNSSNNTLCAGIHTVTVTDFNGCVDSIQITINEPAIIQVSAFQGADTICLTETILIYATATGGDGNYVWDWNNGFSNNDSVWISPTVTTVYTVSVTDGNNCPGATATLTVVVRPALTISTVPDQIVCMGDSAYLEAFATGGDDNYTFTWDQGIGPNNQFWVSPGVTTIYYVTVSDGCSTPYMVDSVLVTIGNLPFPGFDVDNSKGCSPLKVTFTLDTLFPATVYQWNFGDGTVISSYANTVTHTFINSESEQVCFDITLTATTNLGCVTTLTMICMITVYPNPEADFNIYPINLTTIAPTTNFFDQSFGATSWEWDLGDGSSSNVPNFSHTYPDYDTATYTIQLAVFNDYGCSDTSEQTLFLDYGTTIYLPNSFTPDGDGINDYFGPVGEFTLKGGFEFYIFDRWGEIIFKSTKFGTEGHWNGRYRGSGKILQEGTYVYLVKYMEHNGIAKEITGHVTLIK